jgi:hypothetical protein
MNKVSGQDMMTLFLLIGIEMLAMIVDFATR